MRTAFHAWMLHRAEIVAVRYKVGRDGRTSSYCCPGNDCHVAAQIVGSTPNPSLDNVSSSVRSCRDLYGGGVGAAGFFNFL